MQIEYCLTYHRDKKWPFMNRLFSLVVISDLSAFLKIESVFAESRRLFRPLDIRLFSFEVAICRTNYFNVILLDKISTTYITDFSTEIRWSCLNYLHRKPLQLLSIGSLFEICFQILVPALNTLCIIL